MDNILRRATYEPNPHHDRDANTAKSILTAGVNMASEGGGLPSWDETKAVASCESQKRGFHGL